MALICGEGVTVGSALSYWFLFVTVRTGAKMKVLAILELYAAGHSCCWTLMLLATRSTHLY